MSFVFMVDARFAVLWRGAQWRWGATEESGLSLVGRDWTSSFNRLTRG